MKTVALGRTNTACQSPGCGSPQSRPTRHGVDARRFHPECRTNSAHGLASAHAHVDADADRAQVWELAGSMRRQPLKTTVLDKRGDRLLV